jgi:hypothetical protein
MLDSRLDEFEEQRRFVFALLGLLSLSDRIAELLKIRDAGAQPAADSSVLDAALGVLSIRRTLSLALTSPPVRHETSSQSPAAGPEKSECQSWLR